MKERMIQANIIRLGERPADPESLISGLVEGQKMILARRRGRPLKPSAPLIRQALRERAAHL